MEEIIIVFADDVIKEEEKEEFIELVNACDMDIKEVFTQPIRQVQLKTYIGKGKCEEIGAYLNDHEIDRVLFHKDLSPLQIRNLETIWDTAVMDRSELILEIFSRRAKSLTARLQIESAQLKKALPRLIGANTQLGRQSASGKNKGAGEKQLELDRRRIKARIASTTRELKQLEAQRETQRKARSKSTLPLVSLVGYTNAGKSTIMNALLDYTDQKEDKKVLEQDMLFATLDTSIRRIELGHHSFLLSDTVGFVQDLPHELIDAFHSTLEEVTYADLLLEVIDTSNNESMKQMKVTQQTLRTIHAGDIPILHIFNQCDKTQLPYPRRHDQELYISAKDENSIQVLIDTIISCLFPPASEVIMRIPYEKSALYAQILREADIISRDDQEDGMWLEVELPNSLLDKYHDYLMKKESLNNAR